MPNPEDQLVKLLEAELKAAREHVTQLDYVLKKLRRAKPDDALSSYSALEACDKSRDDLKAASAAASDCWHFNNW